jgi:16S rRNA C967 or C1407 C5-methylase (RsmB/RsmF family)
MPTQKGDAAFLDYYEQIFPERYEFDRFIRSLAAPSTPALRFSPTNETQVKSLWQSKNLPWKTLSWYKYALLWPPHIPLKTPLPGFEEKLIYAMNASSLLPVLALDPQPGDVILDACAAPGGKSMFIADLLDRRGHMVANDNSPDRRNRMRQLFDTYGYTEGIEVWARKAETIFKDYPNHFDKILLDAPCSSEKHVFQNPRELKKWSPNRIKALQQRQYALISGLLLALKPGGRLVYSTCAITPAENEGVVGRILASKSKLVELKKYNLPNTPGGFGMPGKYEATFHLSYVHRVLPHRDELDPMFVAIFEKLK